MRTPELPITITQQVQDGCVTASARSFIPYLDVDFDGNFLARLQRFSLDRQNPENNHMLGVAVAAAEVGLSATVHKQQPLTEDQLPDSTPEHVRTLHAQVCAELLHLSANGKVELTTGPLTSDSLRERLAQELAAGRYGLVILDWDKWNKKTQAIFGNPRHIIAIFGLRGQTVLTIDPSVSKEANPVEATTHKLFDALNEKQQLIFIGPKTN